MALMAGGNDPLLVPPLQLAKAYVGEACHFRAGVMLDRRGFRAPSFCFEHESPASWQKSPTSKFYLTCGQSQ
jgi:hypothetical protein